MPNLNGRPLPHVKLTASNDTVVTLADQTGMCVIFCYPYTGRPGVNDPPGWDDIPGAHGSTPQAEAYALAYPKFRERHIEVFGLSFQSSDWQKEFSHRKSLPYLLLSDQQHLFARALGLETFTTGGEEYLKRITLIACHGVILYNQTIMTAPDQDAATSLRLLAQL